MSSALALRIVFALKHCPILSVTYNDFSRFHVEQIFVFKILFLLRGVWSACDKHALQQSVTVLCP